MESFFIVLPSTASSHIYPNTQSHFRVQLAQPIQLVGNWKVGLSEIHVPILYDNIDETTNAFHIHIEEMVREETLVDIPGFSFEGVDRMPYVSMLAHVVEQVPEELRGVFRVPSPDSHPDEKVFTKLGYDVTFSENLQDLLGLLKDNLSLHVEQTPMDSAKHTLSHPGDGLWIKIVHPPAPTFTHHRLSIPPGLYTKTHHLLQAMSDAIPKGHAKSIGFKERRDGRIHISCKPNIRLTFPSNNHGLGTLLGFEDRKSTLPEEAKGEYPVDLKRGIYGLYVYSDLVQPHVVGDTFAPLLRVIPIQEDNQYTSTYVKIYSNPDFYPIIQNQFETIEIDIRTDFGQRLHFRNGKTMVKLLFQKV